MFAGEVLMATTSVHFPRGLLERLDELASKRGTNRNRLVVDACKALVEGQARTWPAGFFDDDDLDGDELQKLRAIGDSFFESIAEARRDQAEPPFS